MAGSAVKTDTAPGEPTQAGAVTGSEIAGRAKPQADAEPEVTKKGGDAPGAIREEDLHYLALTMWGEARGHGEAGMRAVGHVIDNRLRLSKRSNRAARRYGSGSVQAVVQHPWQFSVWNQNDPNRDRMLNIDDLRPGTPDHRAWQLAQQLAADILAGRSTDPTNGAVMYHTTAVNPRWSRSASMVQVTQVDNHVFYKDADVQRV